MDRLIKKGLPLLMPSRVVRVKTKTRLQLVRIFTSLLIITYFVSGVPVGAIGTTPASALVLEEARGSSSLSFSKKHPHSARDKSHGDPCLSLLRSARLSPGAHAQGSSNSSRRQSLSPYGATDRQAASVALGFFLGVRVALGPKDVVKESQRVQIGPEFRMANKGSDSYALAIASYRSCKNNYVLGMRRQK
jgi:hypothetical protein